MTSKTYTSVIDDRPDNGTDYIDINIYVTCPDGSEWRKTVSLNKKSGKLDGAVLCYAESKDTCFDEPKYHPSTLVSLMFNERFDEAATLLREAHNRQTNVKDHAEEMLKVLKSVYVDLRDRYDPPSYILNDMKERVKQVIDKVEGRK